MSISKNLEKLKKEYRNFLSINEKYKIGDRLGKHFFHEKEN